MNGRSGNTPPLRMAVSVPLIGTSKYFGCARGHIERLPAPFAMSLPSPEIGQPALTVPLCRVCWLGFVQLFGARELADDELAALREAGQLEPEAAPPAA